MKSLSELWCDPQAIRFKISPLTDLVGDWDMDRRHDLADAVKHRAIFQRYSEGRDWAETDLFRVNYTARLQRGEGVRGCSTMAALLEQYRTRVDGMFEDLKRHGFRKDAGPLPGFLIGRDGEIFIGNQGNHRLAMAQVLGLPKIAGRVLCRYQP